MRITVMTACVALLAGIQAIEPSVRAEDTKYGESVASSMCTVPLRDPAAEGSPRRVLTVFGPQDPTERQLIYSRR
jgi:hypothetical protein